MGMAYILVIAYAAQAFHHLPCEFNCFSLLLDILSHFQFTAVEFHVWE